MAMFFDYEKDNNNNDVYNQQKYYSWDGAMEIKTNRQTGQTELITYIGGNAYDAPMVYKSNGNTGNFLSLHKDYLGSIIAISDKAGNFVEKRHYDAWGRIALIKGENGENLGRLTVLDRGYTGHEHLASVGLVHMNGRLYDARLHHFLAPDNFLQDPYNTQNYNRYGYVLNNPLQYVDRNGENPLLIAAILGAVIGVTTNGIINSINHQPFFQNGIQAFFTGAIAGMVSYGIGNTLTNSGISGIGKFAVQTFAHGHLGGMTNGFMGGDYLSGFASGAIGSMIAYGTGKLLSNVNNPYIYAGGVVASGGISGGVTSVISGGNFWEGFRNGLISAGLNHVVHSNFIFGEKWAIFTLTGRIRHLKGEFDALSASLSGTVDGMASIGMERGGLLVLAGPDKGFDTITDFGLGLGTVDGSLSVEFTKLYHSGKVNNIRKEHFYGPRTEINLGVNVILSPSLNVSYAKVENLNYKVYGFGSSIGVGLSPTLFSGNINWGASGRNMEHLRKIYKDWLNN